MNSECFLNFSTRSSLIRHLRQPLHHDPAAFSRVILGGNCAQAGIEQDRFGLVENTVAFNIRKFRRFKPGFLVPPAEPVAEPPPVESTEKVLTTTTQWLSVISIIVSLAGVYYKREEIKSFLAKNEMPPPSPVVPRAPPPSPVDAAPIKGIRKMD